MKTHIKHIFRKLNLRDRTQAVILAYDVGLVEPKSQLKTLVSPASGDTTLGVACRPPLPLKWTTSSLRGATTPRLPGRSLR